MIPLNVHAKMLEVSFKRKNKVQQNNLAHG